MKPAWDKLMADFEGDATKLVADVDCTTDDGQKLCEQHNVEGFPTLKWGNPMALEDYNGGREYEELKAFADENLKPMCSPANIDLCDDEQKAAIEKYQAMSTEDLSAAVDEATTKLSDNEALLMEAIEKLQEKYEELMKEKEEKDKAINDEFGLGYMKAVLAAKEGAEAAKGSDEL